MIPLNRCGTSRNPCRWYHHPCLGFAPPKQSAIGPGKKVLFVDDLWKFVDANPLPSEFDRVAQLPRGSFIAYNREHGADWEGKWF